MNQGIDLLNKYYPALGQVTFQSVQQMLPTDPLITGQWANVPQGFSQDQYFEKDKFPDPNAQAESQVNSETQTNKINQQDDTIVPLTGNHSWFGISKYNLIRFLVNPSDQASIRDVSGKWGDKEKPYYDQIGKNILGGI